jgi:hypothetical protein
VIADLFELVLQGGVGGLAGSSADAVLLDGGIVGLGEGFLRPFGRAS